MPIFAICFFGALIVAAHIARINTDRAIIDAWAAKKTLSLIECQYVFGGGPFFGRTNYGSAFHVKAEDKHGNQRWVWIFVGSYPFFADRFYLLDEGVRHGPDQAMFMVDRRLGERI